ncbi:MAG: 5'-nucleotidase [Luteibaculaceae bacterium]|jgi:5'-nucleotidase
MEKRLKILVTNDDGIFAKGLSELVKIAKAFGEVKVVAPDKGQSGMGHAITVESPVRLNKIKTDWGVEAYSCSGTPVDCVKIAISQVFDQKPDLLLSGINHGANNSINVIYSGTMSAAVEGALENIPSIGFSLLNHSADADFSACAALFPRIIERVISDDFPENICLNVNIPMLPASEIKGTRVCRQALGKWDDSFEERTDPMKQPYYWLKGQFLNHDKGLDTDVWALENGYVSIVPTQFDMTAHHAISHLNQNNYGEGK